MAIREAWARFQPLIYLVLEPAADIAAEMYGTRKARVVGEVVGFCQATAQLFSAQLLAAQNAFVHR